MNINIPELDALAERIESALRMAEPDAVYTIAEAAEYLRCSKSYVYQLIDRGGLDYTTLPSKVEGKDGEKRIWRKDLERILRERTITSNGMC